MKREEIIRMAREAGAIPIHKRPKELAVVGNENIERFFQAAYAAGQAAEREACAKVCESMEYEFKAGYECAAAIRERGEQV